MDEGCAVRIALQIKRPTTENDVYVWRRQNGVNRLCLAFELGFINSVVAVVAVIVVVVLRSYLNYSLIKKNTAEFDELVCVCVCTEKFKSEVANKILHVFANTQTDG